MRNATRFIFDSNKRSNRNRIHRPRPSPGAKPRAGERCEQAGSSCELAATSVTEGSCWRQSRRPSAPPCAGTRSARKRVRYPRSNQVSPYSTPRAAQCSACALPTPTHTHPAIPKASQPHHTKRQKTHDSQRPQSQPSEGAGEHRIMPTGVAAPCAAAARARFGNPG